MKNLTEQITTVANDVAMPSGGVLATIAAAVAGSVAAVWSWFRSELDDCKKDRKELFALVQKLNDEVSQLSMRVGNVERSKS
jgi:hypothetical protein